MYTFINASLLLHTGIETQEVHLARRAEDLEHEEEQIKLQRAQIIAGLETQAAEGSAQVEERKKRQRSVDLELGTLRGRLAHTEREQAQWEQTKEIEHIKSLEAAWVNLRQLRRKHPYVPRTHQASGLAIKDQS